MHFDNNGLLVMDQEGFPGNIGDSCAETSRYVTLQYLLGNPPKIDLSPFDTSLGVIDYPSSPWGPNTTSDDQVSPLIAATSLTNSQLCKTITLQVEDAGYKTGNGQFIHPSSFAQLERSQGSIVQGLWDWTIVFQALLFKVPVYWNDGTKSFQTTANDEADYLNFVNFLAFAKQKRWTLACWLATKLTSSSVVMAKVSGYYQKEPNVQWLLDIYQQSIKKVWNE
jgi:hypothetical protein